MFPHPCATQQRKQGEGEDHQQSSQSLGPGWLLLHATDWKCSQELCGAGAAGGQAGGWGEVVAGRIVGKRWLQWLQVGRSKWQQVGAQRQLGRSAGPTPVHQGQHGPGQGRRTMEPGLALPLSLLAQVSLAPQSLYQPVPCTPAIAPQGPTGPGARALVRAPHSRLAVTALLPTATPPYVLPLQRPFPRFPIRYHHFTPPMHLPADRSGTMWLPAA